MSGDQDVNAGLVGQIARRANIGACRTPARPPFARVQPGCARPIPALSLAPGSRRTATPANALARPGAGKRLTAHETASFLRLVVFFVMRNLAHLGHMENICGKSMAGRCRTWGQTGRHEGIGSVGVGSVGAASVPLREPPPYSHSIVSWITNILSLLYFFMRSNCPYRQKYRQKATLLENLALFSAFHGITVGMSVQVGAATAVRPGWRAGGDGCGGLQPPEPTGRDSLSVLPGCRSAVRCGRMSGQSRGTRRSLCTGLHQKRICPSRP